ncbi:MAG: hypothetical protein WDO71_17740 [Bacteroidota bacterium]
MRTILYKIMLVILVGISVNANAQSDSAIHTFSFRIGTYYNSHLNYYGRTDSLRSSGFFPIAELWLNNKFYLNAAPIFTNNSLSGFQYAGTVATAGYLTNNGKSSTHIYLVKPVYKDNSELVQSSLKAQVAVSFTKLNKVINFTAGADVKFSGNTDYGANIGLDHIFRKQFPGNFVLVIDPSVYAYAGTQQFTQTSYEKNGFLIFPGTEKEVTEDVKKFTLLSYEASVPVIAAKGKWMLLATPSFVIPQNIVTIENRPDLSERGKAMFYMTAGAKLSFIVMFTGRGKLTL